jgi:hypothetical protein
MRLTYGRSLRGTITVAATRKRVVERHRSAAPVPRHEERRHDVVAVQGSDHRGGEKRSDDERDGADHRSMGHGRRGGSQRRLSSDSQPPLELAPSAGSLAAPRSNTPNPAPRGSGARHGRPPSARMPPFTAGRSWHPRHSSRARPSCDHQRSPKATVRIRCLTLPAGQLVQSRSP